MSNIYRAILKIVSVIAAVLCTGACESQYDELPPKTDASVQYAIPSPEEPTKEEIELFKAIRSEHNNNR